MTLLCPHTLQVRIWIKQRLQRKWLSADTRPTTLQPSWFDVLHLCCQRWVGAGGSHGASAYPTGSRPRVLRCSWAVLRSGPGEKQGRILTLEQAPSTGQLTAPEAKGTCAHIHLHLHSGAMGEGGVGFLSSPFRQGAQTWEKRDSPEGLARPVGREGS